MCQPAEHVAAQQIYIHNITGLFVTCNLHEADSVQPPIAIKCIFTWKHSYSIQVWHEI